MVKTLSMVDINEDILDQMIEYMGITRIERNGK